MAFQQPIHRPTRRAHTPPPIATTTQVPKKPEQVETSQEWILFSPTIANNEHEDRFASAAAQTATPVTPRTFPRSRLSDFGSLDTAVVSARHRGTSLDEKEVEEDEDDADSLDDGLHAFNEPTSASNPSAHHCLDSSIAEPMLPTHDGLGGFNGSSLPTQQQLWQHEKYNPKRNTQRSSHLRKSSIQRRLDVLNEKQDREAPKDATEERNRRIEKWRLDQSRAIVDEIERETRRQRRKSKLSQSVLPRSEQEAMPSSADTAPEAAVITPDDLQTATTESLWSRARRVIRDFIGVDDSTLSYIFGESIPDNEESKEPRNSENPMTAAQMIEYAENTVPKSLDLMKSSSSWEDNLIARIARELGSLVNTLSEQPQGVFGTYMKVQETVPYAGLPTPTDVSTPAGFFSFDPPISVTSHRQPNSRYRHRRRVSAARTDPSLFGIEEEAAIDEETEKDNDLTPQQTRDVPLQTESQRLQRDYEYWEKDLDLKMVFGYLKSRLGRRKSSFDAPTSNPRLQSSVTGTTFSTHGTSTGADTLRRAALIRHHHPLVSRNVGNLRTSSLSQSTNQTLQSPAVPMLSILGRRNSSVIDDGASSCASQSTKKSKTHHSGSLSISSSRNYWDIGGPSWGEV